MSELMPNLTDRNFFGWFHHRVKISVIMALVPLLIKKFPANCCGVRDATYSDAPQGKGTFVAL
jgi:hypothetical protein